MSLLLIILFLVIFSLIGLFIWNGINFNSLKKHSKLKDEQLNDSKYWELKYKFEFLVAIVGIITAVIGLLGYNSLKSIESSVKVEFNKKVDSVQTKLQTTVTDFDSNLNHAKDSVRRLNGNVRDFQSSIQQNTRDLNSLNHQQDLLQQLRIASEKNLKSLSKQIDSINANNKIKKEFYLVTNVSVKGTIENTLITFSELRTNTGDKLPIFKKPPIVIPAFAKDVELRISSTTEKDFQLQVLDYSGISVDEAAKLTYPCSFIIYEVD